MNENENFKNKYLVSVKDYENLYYKYKKKYLNLKKQIGSAHQVEHIPNNSLYLPCEINNYTRLLFISKDWQNIINILVNELNGSGIEIITIDDQLGPGFAQDYSIILKDRANNNYSFKLNPNVLYPDPNGILRMFDCYNEQFNGNNLGGNYISSPNNIIFTLDDTANVTNCLDPLLINNIVPLECSFRYRGQRHIDEVMCFMPYGVGQFKIWIYYIRHITISTELINLIKYVKDNIITEYNQLQNQVNSNPGNDVYANQFKIYKRKITYNMTQIINIINQGIDINPENLQGIIRDHLNNEQIRNKHLLIYHIFGNDYRFSDRFVDCPLDLHIGDIYFNQKLQFHSQITNVPVFNRLLIDHPDFRFKKCFISIGHNIDPEVNQILTNEAPFIRSMFDNENFNIINISTTEQNARGQDRGGVGGNLHCLVKNVY